LTVTEAQPVAAESDTLPGRLTLADFITLGNATCGFLAIYSIAAAMLHHVNTGAELTARSLSTAVALLLIGAACDLLDGAVARRFGGSSLGAHLDNLADVISFGLAPAFLLVAWGTLGPGNNDQPLAVATATVVLLSVVVRLARFASTPGLRGIFQGLPCPMGALTVVAIVFLDLPVAAAALASIGVAWMMVSRITYPKPSGKPFVAALTWITVGVGCLVAFAIHAPGADQLVKVSAALQVVLTAAIPVYAKSCSRDRS
jgi:CDP-diacylglycerol--serine O-phosphatidyltransferase